MSDIDNDNNESDASNPSVLSCNCITRFELEGILQSFQTELFHHIHLLSMHGNEDIPLHNSSSSSNNTNNNMEMNSNTQHVTSSLLHETKENEILVTSLTVSVSVDYL